MAHDLVIAHKGMIANRSEKAVIRYTEHIAYQFTTRSHQQVLTCCHTSIPSQAKTAHDL
ncbi:hypothetical protein ABN584_11285 [Gloeocapsa sp. BRSZ]